MNYRIEISPDAQREVRNLPGYVRAQFVELLEILAKNPQPARAKELREKPNIYRIWLATHWRVVYRVEHEWVYVEILRVRLKGEIDYDTV